MKLLIIGFTKIRYMPYLTFYLNAIDKVKNNITVLYWNRDGIEDIPIPNGVEGIEFNFLLQDSERKIRKIPAFMAFRKKVVEILNEISYDFIIVLHTIPAVLISDLLLRKYKGRFILDYRDYTFEKILPYKWLIGRLAKASRKTFVSSNAFRVYLPKIENIYTSHNITFDTITNRPGRHTLSTAPLRIRYWGLIRYADTNIKLISKIKNDPRFEFHFHGRIQAEGELIAAYCRDNNVKNVYFHGEYKTEDKFLFAKETDLIQNAQDYDEITRNAISNKFYDGAIFYIPQICTDISYMGQCLERYGIGLSCNVNDDSIAEKLVQYVKSLDIERFCNNCDKFIDQIVKEYTTSIEELKKLFG